MLNQKVIVYQLFPRLFGNKNTQIKVDGSKSENGSGKFKDVNSKALRELKNMGVTHVWYTGIIEHAVVEGYPDDNISDGNPLVIKGKAGSPYAIKDYYDVNPDLAVDVAHRMDEFESLIDRTHKAGLKVLVDFVPNHLAREYSSDARPQEVKDFGVDDDDSQLFDVNNNFYYLPGKQLQLSDEIKGRFPDKNYEESVAKATGNDQFIATPNSNDWFETVKLNYGIDYTKGGKKHFDPIPDTWFKMKHILHYWGAKGVDGFRCDMVEMVPVEFWNWVVPQIKHAFPWLIFIAEVYNPKLYSAYIRQGKFDYLYDKVGLYDTLIGIIKSERSTKDISECWQQLDGLDRNMLRFMENHDEQRLASRFIVGEAKRAIPAMAVSAFMHQGPLMIYNGQEVGEVGEGPSGYSGDDGRTTIFDYWNMPEHQKWMNGGLFDGALLTEGQRKLRQEYATIIGLCANSAISEGLFYDLMWQNTQCATFNSDRLYAFLRYSKEQQLLVVVNFDTVKQVTSVQLPAHAFEALNIPRPIKIEFNDLINNVHIEAGSEELINVGLPIGIDALNYVVLEMDY